MRRGVVWPISLVLFLSAVALTMVSQNVHYTRAWLKFEDARRHNESLGSDLNAQHMKVHREATLSQLVPRARQRLGLVDSPTTDMRLVAFNDPDPVAPSSEPGFLDRIVPAAVAREDRPSKRANLKETGKADQDLP
jgi:hypothetical protein